MNRHPAKRVVKALPRRVPSTSEARLPLEGLFNCVPDHFASRRDLIGVWLVSPHHFDERRSQLRASVDKELEVVVRLLCNRVQMIAHRLPKRFAADCRVHIVKPLIEANRQAVRLVAVGIAISDEVIVLRNT